MPNNAEDGARLVDESKRLPDVSSDAMVPPDEAMFGKKYQGVEKRSTGYKLLAAMGWKEGEGLGASKQGIKEHVRVKKKADTIGVGLKEAAEHSKDWKIGMVAFDHVLSALKEVRAQHDKTAASSDDSSSDEETPQPAPSASKKRRAEQAAKEDPASDKNKKKRKANDAAEQPATSPAATVRASKKQKIAEPEAEAAEAVAAKKATHLGRFARREAGKRVKGYSATDLAAILGGGASEAETKATASAAPKATVPPAHAEEPVSSSDASEETALEVGDEAGTAQPQEDETGKWWTKCFSRAGKMGSRPAETKNPTKPKVNVHGFSEQDQVDLYSLTQDGASKSKQGLGKANAPKKVAGANWEGTKIRIGDSDSEPAEKDPSNDALDNGVHTDAQEEQTEPEMGVKQQAHSIVLPKSKQGPQADSSGKKRKKAKAASAAAPLKPSADGATAAATAPTDKVKWKKICKQVLSSEPDRKLPSKELVIQAAALAELSQPPELNQLLARLRDSSQFHVSKKHVSLT